MHDNSPAEVCPLAWKHQNPATYYIQPGPINLTASAASALSTQFPAPVLPIARGAKLYGVEAGRGIAALLVVLVHASFMLAGPKYFGRHPFAGLFEFGRAGVDFFFVLSGFIIYYVHYQDIGQPDTLLSYYWKRFIRIYPSYWIVTAIWGLILIYSPTADRSEQQWGTIVTTASLLPLPAAPILGVAWTLKHEMLFYTLFGLLIIDRRIGVVALTVWGLCIAWNVSLTCATGTPYFSGLAGDLFFRVFNFEFFFGMLVGHLVRSHRGWHPAALLILGIVLFLLTGLMESWGPELPNEWPPRHFGYALGAALAIYGLACTERSAQLRVPSFLRVLGTASYSIYLVHAIVIMILQQLLLRTRHFIPFQLEVTFLFYVAVAVAAGVVFSSWIEQPLLRRMRRGLHPSDERSSAVRLRMSADSGRVADAGVEPRVEHRGGARA